MGAGDGNGDRDGAGPAGGSAGEPQRAICGTASTGIPGLGSRRSLVGENAFGKGKIVDASCGAGAGLVCCWRKGILC